MSRFATDADAIKALEAEFSAPRQFESDEDAIAALEAEFGQKPMGVLETVGRVPMQVAVGGARQAMRSPALARALWEATDPRVQPDPYADYARSAVAPMPTDQAEINKILLGRGAAFPDAPPRQPYVHPIERGLDAAVFASDVVSGQAGLDLGRKDFDPRNKVEEIAQGVGSTGVQLAQAAIPAAAGQAVGIPAPLTFGAVNAAQVYADTFDQAYRETGDHGRSREEAAISSLITLGTSGLSGIGLFSKLPGIDKLIRNAAGRAIARVAVGGVSEGLQEPVEGFAQELTTEIVRHRRDLSPEMVYAALTNPARLDEAIIGSIVGGGAKAVLDYGGTDPSTSDTRSRQPIDGQSSPASTLPEAGQSLSEVPDAGIPGVSTYRIQEPVPDSYSQPVSPDDPANPRAISPESADTGSGTPARNTDTVPSSLRSFGPDRRAEADAYAAEIDGQVTPILGGAGFVVDQRPAGPPPALDQPQTVDRPQSAPVPEPVSAPRPDSPPASATSASPAVSPEGSVSAPSSDAIPTEKESEGPLDYFAPRKADIEQIRKQFGMRTLDSPERRTKMDEFDLATKQGIPERAVQIATDILNNPRPVTSTEAVGLSIRGAHLMNQLEAANKRMEAFAGDEGNLFKSPEHRAAEAEQARVRSELDTISLALGEGGSSETARALNARKFAIEKNNYQPVMVRRRAVSRKGKKLSPVESNQFETLSKKYDEANAKIEELSRKLREKQAQDAVRHRGGRPRSPQQRAVDYNTALAKARELIKAGCR